jgi:hypothetical protein
MYKEIKEAIEKIQNTVYQLMYSNETKSISITFYCKHKNNKDYSLVYGKDIHIAEKDEGFDILLSFLESYINTNNLIYINIYYNDKYYKFILEKNKKTNRYKGLKQIKNFCKNKDKLLFYLTIGGDCDIDEKFFGSLKDFINIHNNKINTETVEKITNLLRKEDFIKRLNFLEVSLSTKFKMEEIF